jgi:myxalamid-type polyketide synthase MxaE and MxaD
MLNLPALSICWGPWAEIGMAAHLADRQQNIGVTPIDPNEGIKALEFALQNQYEQLIFAHVDWKTFTQKLQHPLSLLSRYITGPKEKKKSSWLLDLKAALPGQREKLLSKNLHNLIQKLLGIDDSNGLSEEKGFFDMGMNSLMALELKSILQKELGSDYSLSPTFAFEYPNIKSLAGHLNSLLFPVEKEPEIKSEPEPIKEVKVNLDEMSRDDLYKLIEEG